jgi:hypothetical protein
MKVLVYGSRGWIGKQFIEILKVKGVEYVEGIARVDNDIELFEELYKYFPLIKKTNINYSLYSNDNPDKSEKVSFKNKEEAIKSIEKIKKKSHTYQVKVILTLYNRAKYHPHQTSDMRKAMLIFSKWLIKNKK